MQHDSGLEELSHFVQQVLGLAVAETATDAEPDFRGLGSRGYSVVHGRRSCVGSHEPYHVATMRNLTQKERDFLFALRARDDVAEENILDAGISRAAGQKLLHASSLVVEDASADPVWLQLPGRSNQVPAMRWVNSTATMVSEKVQYTQADTPFMSGLTLAEFELLVPRGHMRYKQPGLPAKTLHRHCRNEIDPPLPEVLRKTPLYVAAATIGITCRVGVIAHPDGFQIVITDCDEVTREILVPFDYSGGSFSDNPWPAMQHCRSTRAGSEFHGSESLRSALQEALSQWVQDADAKGVPHWELLWVTPASASYLLACLEPSLRWPPQPDSVMVAAKAEIVLSFEAFSAALRQALQDVKRDESLRPSHAATVFMEVAGADEEDDSPRPRSRSRTQGQDAPRLLTTSSTLEMDRLLSLDELQAEMPPESPKVRHASSLANWSPTLEQIVPVPDTRDPSRQQRYIAKLQDNLAEELAIAMGIDPGDVIVSSIEEDENGNWKAIFSANATKTEMDQAMSGKSERTFPTDGPDVRLKKLQTAIKGGGFAKDDRFTMLRHVDANLHVHEVERLQITDTSAWCRGLGGFTPEDTRKLTGIFLTPEAIYRKAYNGTGLREEDLKRLRDAGFTDADLRRLGLLGYGLSEDETARLEIAGFDMDDLQRRLLTGDLFSKDEQNRLKAEGLPLERIRRLLAGTGRFSKAEKERLADVDLPEMEIRRRLILGEEFTAEEILRLEEVDLPLHELRRRVLGGEIFDRDERLRLDVVGLHEDEILRRLADRDEFSEDEMFSLESAGFDVEDLHRRVHGESTFAPTELQRLQALGFTEDEIIRRLCDGMGFEDDELRRLELAGFSLAKLTRRVFGTSNPTKEEETQSRLLSGSLAVAEGQRRLDESQLKRALRRLTSDAHLLNEDEQSRLADCGLPIDEIHRRLSTGEGFSDLELLRINTAGLSDSLHRLAPSINDMDEEDRERLENCGIPVEEIKRRTLCGEDFTLEEIDRIHAGGFSIDALQRSVMAEEDSDSSSDDEVQGTVLWTKAKAVKKKVEISMPFADELARLLQNRYVSHEKSATNAMQTQALDELRAAASRAADDPTEVTLAELAKAIAVAIHAEVEDEHIGEATELLQMLRAQFLLTLLEGTFHLEDIAELGAMLSAVEGKVRELDLFRGGGNQDEEAEGMLLGFYPRDLDPRRALRGLITRARTKQEKANAEARLEEVMDQIQQLPLDNIMQVQRSLSLLQDAMRVGEEVGASPVLMFSAEELLRDLQNRKARYDDFHAERSSAWTHLQQSLQGLQASIGATISQKKALQYSLLNQDWRTTRIPSQYREVELTMLACPVGKGLQTSLTNFLEINFASTEDLQTSTENLIELLPAVAGLVAFFQLPPPADAFQLHDRKEDLISFSPQLTTLVESASPPIGPIPALLKDLLRDLDKLIAMWSALEIEAMPKGLHQAIMSGITELVEACLSVCSDREAVIGRVRDDRGGNSVHLAAVHGHWKVIEVLIANGADIHAKNSSKQSALDVAIETLHKIGEYDHQVELSHRLQETIDYLDEQHKVVSYDYVKYEKKHSWFKRPDTMLKWLRLKSLLESNFDNLKRAFLEIDTNHSGGIVKYEWEAMFGAEGQVKEALVAADLESNDVFGMLDGLDVEGKDMVITKSAFELLDLLDWHLTSKIWQDLLLKPLMVKHNPRPQRTMAITTAF